MADFVIGTSQIEIEGQLWIIQLMLDEDGEATLDPAAAVKLVCQRPGDVRPLGEKQTYRGIEIHKGSLCPVPMN